MSLLLSQAPAPFNPANGFPYQQQPNPPVHNVAPRCVALALAACSFVFVPSSVDPGAVPTWLPDYPDFPARDAPQPTSRKELSEVWPAPQFGTAVRFSGVDQNNGLEITTNLPGPSNFSVSCFIYVPVTPAADSTVWMVQDTHGTTPANYINIEITSIRDVAVSSNPSTADVIFTAALNQWYFLSVSVGTAGAYTAYWCKVGSPLNTVPGATALSTGWTPASFTVGTDYFVEPFDGRITGLKVHSAAISSGDAAAEATQIAPVRSANLQQAFKLEHATTKLVDSAYGRNLTAIGAGTWVDQPGPFLQPGNFNPQFGFPYEQYTNPPQRAVDNPLLRSWYTFVFVPTTGFDPSTSPSWLPDYPDFARTAPRPVNAGGLSWTNLEREPIVDWLPNYPDFARGAVQPVNQGGLASFINVDFVRFLSWEPQFADFARAALRAVNTCGQASFDNVDFVPKLSWAPTFSDFAGRAALRPVNEGGLFRTHLEYEPTDWFPYYQDMVPAAPRALELREGGATFVNPDFVPKLAWAPTFSDFPGRSAPRPVNTGGQVFWTNLEREPIVDWLPDYPDFARVSPRPVNQGGQASFDNVDFVRFLSWAPDFADFARVPLRPVNVGGQAALVIQEREPIVDWLPDYPSFLHNPLTPANINRSMFAYVDLDFVPRLAWAPDYPSQISTKPAAIVQNNVFVQTPTAARLVSLSGSLSFAGADTKQTGKVVVGGVSTSGALSKQADKSLSGSLSFTGSLVRLASVILAGTLDLGATLRISTNKSLSGAVSFVGAVNKQINKRIVGTLSFLSDLIVDFIHGTTQRVSIEGSVGFSGSTQRSISRLMIGTLSFVGSPAKAMTRAVAGVVSFVGTVSIRRLLEYVIISTTEFVKKAFASKTQTSQGGSIDSQTQDSSKATINKTDSSNGKIKPGE